MTSRERIFAALLGERVDRVPTALGFRPTPVAQYAPNDYSGPLPDAVSVSFKKKTWLLDLVERPELAHALLDRLRDMCVSNAQILAHAGVDILVLDDDVGMPTSMIIGRDLWAKYLKPRMVEIIAAGRAINPDLLVLYHSDGWILPIIDELIEIGVNALNPIQPDVVDPMEIKRQFGDRITLWGAVGTQGTFSDTTPEAVASETQMRLETLGPDRLVLCPAYDLVESNYRWPNIEAFLQQVAKH
ncbi:MAG: hypothetical protein HN521_02605 [Candidatus Latescibacteria bacterium]|nr:hypothetical protein [Candidatus Latescibacterota bacterium]